MDLVSCTHHSQFPIDHNTKLPTSIQNQHTAPTNPNAVKITNHLNIASRSTPSKNSCIAFVSLALGNGSSGTGQFRILHSGSHPSLIFMKCKRDSGTDERTYDSWILRRSAPLLAGVNGKVGREKTTYEDRPDLPFLCRISSLTSIPILL